MEPMLIPEGQKARSELADLAMQLASTSAKLAGSVSSPLDECIAELVRSMNCYYSNLIEGHNTHPVDIERALKNNYSKNPEKRNLQQEAKAHIEVQKWIDGGHWQQGLFRSDCLRLCHQKFCEKLPDELLWVEDPQTKKRLQVVPGELRTSLVQVGRHVSISPGAVPRFLGHFENVYERLGQTNK